MTILRPQSLEPLESRRFDLLVIGGGIIGARVAYEAAWAGLSVVLVDAGDFGGATSSASSKLLHGGFRYLARFRTGLVRQAQRERSLLAAQVGSHLASPCPLVVFVPRSHAFGRTKLAAGIAIYDALAGFRSPRPRLIGREEASAFVPALDAAQAGALGLIHELQTHDARLTLATIGAAVRVGVTAASYAEVKAFDGSSATVEGGLGGGVATVRFRAVINAAGPWLDGVRRLDNPSARPIARLSKGVQALLVLPEGWRAGLAVFDEHRSVFAVPWQKMLLLGVTDEAFDGDPSTASPTKQSVRNLRNALAPFLAAELLADERVLSVSAGVRVLPRGRGATADAPREHVIETSRSGMVSVGGGKLTTQRLIALEALSCLPPGVRPRRNTAACAPLPGAEPAPRLLGVDPSTAAHLRSIYGGRSRRVVACARNDPDWLEPIHKDGPDIWAQARFAVLEEWAMTAEDVLQRRTTVALRGLGGIDVQQELRERFGRSREGIVATGQAEISPRAAERPK